MTVPAPRKDYFKPQFVERPRTFDFAQGACTEPNVDPEWFFPEPGSDAGRAKMICSRCPIKNACLEYHLMIPRLEGIFGGTSPRQRQRLRLQRTANKLAV